MKIKAAAVAPILTGLAFLAYRKVRARNRLDLRDKVVLITGGSRGLGLAMAREFGAQGAVVAICARNADELKRAQAGLNGDGIRALSFVCDVTDQRQVDATVDEIARTLGPVDVLVNNAGVIRVGPAAQMTVGDFDDAMKVMFWGPLYTTLSVLPGMRERGRGSIVNITSIGGKVSVPHLLPYCCAKFAASALSEGLRGELAPCGIRVTTIVPGLMRTGSHLKAQFKGNHSAEYTWFAAGAATPVISISAERAARSIVEATIQGRAEKILSLPADALARAHGAAPSLTASVLAMANRFLPGEDPESRTTVPGSEIETTLRSRVWKMATAMGQRAAESLNEVAPAEEVPLRT